jgi:ABC-type dipeptide/oligopeptide/nickel transport system ATPase subunit
MSRSFEYNDAVRKSEPLKLGIMGPSGGGKTFSALRLATGIQRIVGGDIAVADTESGRALKYDSYFRFKHIPFTPPYRSLDYLTVAEHAVSKGAKIVIFDSATHEHAGIGGYLEFAEAELDRMAGQDWGKRQACKLASFIKPGQERRKMIDGLLALDVNMIFLFRAKEKVKPIKNDKGKTEIENIGFMPIGSAELVFEMDACCLLMPHAGGVPTWQSEETGEKMMIKNAKQFEEIFRDPQPLSETIGEQLAKWAAGPVRTEEIVAEYTRIGDEKAKLGVEELKKWWSTVPAGAAKTALKDKLAEWKRVSEGVPAPTP